MNRFFLPSESISGERVEFPEDISRQIARVLRLRMDDRVIVLDNHGFELEVKLDLFQNSKVGGQIIRSQAARGEPQTSITLYLGLTQREKFEWILQKGTEIGVSVFSPLITHRSLVQSGEEEHFKKMERWQRIIREAAEQSRRGFCPEILLPQAISKLKPLEKGHNGLVLWEEEQGLGIKEALVKSKGKFISLLIGPEGGLEAEEIERVKALGFQAVTLGPRILRMETAAIVAAALVLFELGDMDANR